MTRNILAVTMMDTTDSRTPCFTYICRGVDSIDGMTVLWFDADDDAQVFVSAGQYSTEGNELAFAQESSKKLDLTMAFNHRVNEDGSFVLAFNPAGWQIDAVRPSGLAVRTIG